MIPFRCHWLLLALGIVCCHARVGFSQPAANEIAQPKPRPAPGYVPAADGGLGSTMTLEQPSTKPQRQTPKEDVPWHVVAAAEPVPAIKYRLWPDERSLQPGSAQLHFYRALAHYLLLPREKRIQLNEVWFTDQPLPDAKTRHEVVMQLQPIYEELHAMALCEDFTWDHRWRDLRGADLYAYRLHDVQEARSLARLLALRVDDHLARGEFTEAIEALADGYRLAYLVAQGETLVQQLVGIAIEGIMSAKVEDAIRIPGCPNLYWALATLPKPLNQLRRAMLIEHDNLTRIFPALDEAHDDRRDDAYWNQAWADVVKDLQSLGMPGRDSQFAFALASASVTFAGPAKERLIAGGMDPAKVDAMPDMRAVLLDASIELRIMRDEANKASLLPYPVSRDLIKRETRELQLWIKERELNSAAGLIASLLLPASETARLAEVRALYVLHRLMTIEALRMHAADGDLPETLAELRPVPAMPDPFSGEPMKYSLRRSDNETIVELDGDVPPQFEQLSKRVLRFPKP